MNINQYTTSSLPLAAAILLESDSKLLYIDKKDKRKSSFVFEGTSNLPHIIDNFWKKKLTVDAFSYFESLRYIKSRLYQEDYQS